MQYDFFFLTILKEASFNNCIPQYIGETKRRLKDRFNEHRSPVDKDKALNHDLSPEYISELLNKPKYTRNLRSQSQHLLSVPKSRTVTYGDRAFSVCAPKLWNELPFQLRMSSNIQAFKSGLKTMLFKMAYL